MKTSIARLALTAFLLGAATASVLAASSTASSASDAASSTVGSLSTSVRGSSNSSKATVAEGDYRIIEVADMQQQPGWVRLKLQAVADASAEGELQLDLPGKTWRDAGLAAGDLIVARTRAYGVEFAEGRTRHAFFLALTDEWLRDLQTQPVI